MQKYFFIAISLTLFGVLSLSACQEASCVVGRQTSCACPGGDVGFQVCLADGSYGACDCAASPAGPATGTGGATSTTSTSGGGGTGPTSSTGGSGGMMCPSGETLCSDVCVDLMTDDANCGACATACPMGTACSGGQCACAPGKKLCGADCIDVLSDAQNCGACSHDCLGTGCTNGLCEASTLATLQQEPFAIALAGSDVYIASAGTNNHLAKVSQQGGTLEVLASGQKFPRDVAVVGDTVLWTNKGVGANGGEVNRYEIMSDTVSGVQSSLLSGVWAIAAQGDYVYWSNQAAHTVSRSDISLNQTIEILATVPGGTPWDIAVNGTHVYWTDYDGSDLRRVPIGGGTQDQIVKSLSQPTGIAIDSTYVYWAEEGAGRIARAKLAGGTVEVIATGQNTPAFVAVDGVHVYWTNYVADGTVMRAPIDGGAAVTLAAKQDKPYAVALKGGYVYWSNFDGGQVMRVAK